MRTTGESVFFRTKETEGRVYLQLVVNSRGWLPSGWVQTQKVLASLGRLDVRRIDALVSSLQRIRLESVGRVEGRGRRRRG